MTNWYILDEQNIPRPANSFDEYSDWLAENFDKKIVNQEEVKGRYVSTVFLGLDHSYDFGTPVLFETMIFPTKGNYSEIYMDRCHDYEEAQKMHQKAVQWVLDGEIEE